MITIAILTSNESGPNSLTDINANFAALKNGIQPQTANETVDGNTSIFTFPTLTAQPTFIKADGVDLRATSSKGTTNWTWNQGATQATMTIPPQDDILAII